MSEGLNQYVVYRLKRALRETRIRRHQSYQYLQKYQMEVISDLYDEIYLSEFDPFLSPLQLRRQLEKELPADSAGETLAISDVLAITRYGITSAYYVDPDKLVSLTGFFHVPSSRELLTTETTDFQIEGRPGTWLVAEDIWIDGNHFFLMQNQFFGRKAACAVLDSRGHPAAEDTTNGFSDAVIKQIREYIHGQNSENKNSVPDEPPKLEPIQSSDIDEKTDFPLVAGNESGRIGVVGSIVEQIDSKPKTQRIKNWTPTKQNSKKLILPQIKANGKRSGDTGKSHCDTGLLYWKDCADIK